MKQKFCVKCKSEKNGALTPSNLPQQWDGGEKGEKYFAPRRTFLAKIGEKTTEFHLCRPLLISAVTRWMRYFDRRRTFLAKIRKKQQRSTSVTPLLFLLSLGGRNILRHGQVKIGKYPAYFCRTLGR